MQHRILDIVNSAVKWSLTVLAFAFPLAFILLPAAMIFGGSVFDGNVWNGSFTFSHYVDVYTKAYQVDLLWNTACIAFLTTLFTALLALPMAVILGRSDVPFRRALSAMALLPFVVPPYLIALNWVFLIGNNGMWQEYFKSILGRPEDIMPLQGIWGASFIMALCYFPLVFLLTQAALQWVHPEQEEAGRLSLSRFGVFWKITFRLTLPTFLMALMFVMVIAMTTFDVPAFLMVNVYSIQILTEFTSAYRPKEAAALALPLVALSMVMVMIIRSFLSRQSFTTEGGRNETPLFVFGRFKRLVSLFPMTVVGLVCILPFYTFWKVAEGWPMFDAMIRNVGENIIIGAKTSAVAAMIMTASGMVIAYWSLRAPRPWQRWSIDMSYLLALAIPPTLVGIGLIQLYNQPGAMKRFFYSTYWIIVAADIARFLPFAVLILRSGMRKISLTSDEAADCCGLPWWKKFYYIYVLRMKQPMFNAFVVTGLFSLGELPAVQLVAPPGGTTLPIRVFTILHYGQDKMLAAMAATMMAFAAVFFLLYYLFTNRRLELM